MNAGKTTSSLNGKLKKPTANAGHTVAFGLPLNELVSVSYAGASLICRFPLREKTPFRGAKGDYDRTFQLGGGIENRHAALLGVTP